MIGIPLCLAFALVWHPRHLSGLPRPNGSDYFFWCSILLLLLAVRWLPVLLGGLPRGLVWEEHQSARAAQAVLAGGTGTLLHGLNDRLLALAFSLLGNSDYSVRLYAVTLCSISVIFFAEATRLLFGRRTALVCSGLIISAPSYAIAGFFADEGFALTHAVFAAFLLCAVRMHVSPSPLFASGLGVVTGVAFFEYAALKPIILFGPLACVSALAAQRHQLEGKLRLSLITACLCSLLLIGLPMLNSLARGDADFFDGRRDTMIGEKAPLVLTEKLQTLPTAVNDHFNWTFLGGHTGMSFMKSPADPVVDSALSIGALFGILTVVVTLTHCFIWCRGLPSSDIMIRAMRCLFWVIWGGVLLTVSSLWNPTDFHPHRMAQLVPLSILVLGEGLSILERAQSRSVQRVTIFAGLLILLVGVPLNGQKIYSHLSQRTTEIGFRDKMQGLCDYLGDLPDLRSRRYVVTWDWDYELYIGDSDPSHWATGLRLGGHDAWGCSKNVPMAPFHLLHLNPERHQLLKEGKFTSLLIATRVSSDEEFLKEEPTVTVARRLDERLNSFKPVVRPNSCRMLFSSKWFGYLDCPLARN